MSSALVIAFILLSSLIMGSFILLHFLTLPVRLRIDRFFAALVLGIGLEGWLALLLAEGGIFSFGNLLTIWGAALFFLVILLWWRKIRGKNIEWSKLFATDDFKKERRWNRLVEGLILAAWIVIASWLFFRPHEYIMGAADAGVYISLGSEIAQNGGFAVKDEGLAELDLVVASSVLRPLPENPIASSYLVPGFYVADSGQGAITPQFYPLHPTWLAVAFSAAGTTAAGIRAELLMTGLWMMLSTISIYLLARQLSGRYTAILVLLALSISALQVWFARYPSTEALTQFLIWSGLWALMMWLGERPPQKMWAMLSGLMLGSVFLVRIDILIILPVIILFIIALWARGWQNGSWWFFIPFTGLTLQSLAHGALLSAPYFYEHIGFGLSILWKIWLIPVMGVLIGTIFLILVYYLRGRFSVLERFQRSFQIILIAIILFGTFYAWFIRPYMGQALLVMDDFSQSELLVTNHENLIRLGWYLFPTGLLFGVLGCCLLIWHARWKTAVMVAVGILFSALYLWNVRANPHHVYVMRRYIPVVFPFFILCGAYFLGWLASRSWVRPVIPRFWLISSVVLSGIWLAGLGWSARGFISQVDHAGVFDQLEIVESNLEPGSVLIFNDQSPVGLGDFWGTPLKFIFGHTVFTLRDPSILDAPQLVEMIEIWQNNGRSVVWIGEEAWLDEHQFPYQRQIIEISSQRLESSYEHKPQAIVPVRWILPIAHIEQR